MNAERTRFCLGQKNEGFFEKGRLGCLTIWKLIQWMKIRQKAKKAADWPLF